MTRTHSFALSLALLISYLIVSSGCHRAVGTAPSPKVPLASAPLSAIRFVDIAEAAGLCYRWTIPGKRPLTLLQTIGNGCALLDIDNDGILDILLVGPKLALFRGDGRGHFTDVTTRYGLDKLRGDFLGCAVGDYDNDGFEDIYLSGYRTGILLHNEYGKQFRDVTAAMGLQPHSWGTSAAFADIDGDGRLDLYVGDYVQFGPDSMQLCLYNHQMAACGPRAYPAVRGILYRNLGDKFKDVTREWGADCVEGKTLGVAFADYDGSGHPSLALANDEKPGNLLHNSGGKFTDVGVASGTAYDRLGNAHGGMGVDWGDYDNDGKLDLLVATFQYETKNLYHNEGVLFTDYANNAGLAVKTSPYVTFGAKFLDVDNDGWLDILFTNGHTQNNTAHLVKDTTYRQPTQLFRNRNGRDFEEISDCLIGTAGQPIVGRGLAIGDFDNDGRMDALVVDSEGAPLLLHNETSSSGHWLEVKLVGTKSNRDGIGALITFCTSDGCKLVRRCATDGSYLSASDVRVHCGLGQARQATLRVKWPDGHQDVYANILADHIVTLREGVRAP